MTNNSLEIHPDSAKISMNNLLYINTPFASALNYIDENDKHPLPTVKINPKDIVFTKDELIEGKWLILFPSHINNELKLGIIETLRHWGKINVRIVIQSENRLRKELKRRKLKTEEDCLKKKRSDEKMALEMDNFEFLAYDKDPLKIPREFIKDRYNSVEEFKNRAPNCKYLFDYKDKIISKYQNGDEILYYSEFDDSSLGDQKEIFMLIRNGKIIYSPLFSERRVCFALPRIIDAL